MISSRGTSSYLANDSEENLWIRNKNTVKSISKTRTSRKITTMRGTNYLWLTEQTKQNHLNTNKISLLVQRGTKKITIFLNSSLSKKTTIKKPHVENLTCDTCKNKISSDISRYLIMHDKDNAPRFFSIHFFASCWNSEIFFKKYSDWTLDRAGFLILEDTPMTEKGMKALQSDESFWY